MRRPPLLHTWAAGHCFAARPYRIQSSKSRVVRSFEILNAMMSQSEFLAAMPKAELHLHLDGCLRLQTIADLAMQQEIALPVPPDRLGEVCVAPPRCRDLVEVLSYFVTPLEVLQTPQALERVTYELCEDLHGENVRYVEIRFAPSLHRERGMRLDQVIEAVARGWQAGRRAFRLSGGVILCGMRHLPPEETLRAARAGAPFLGRGVVGFDLAGDEAHFPVAPFRDALLWAKDAGYGMTVHAGEAAGARSVRDAVEMIGVSRIGHGTHAGEDPALLGVLKDREITLEMCPTSNVQTGSVSNLAAHPLPRYYRQGIRVTVNSDNRTVADTTLDRELRRALEMGLSPSDLAAMTLMALEAGFADMSERRALQAELQGEMEALGVVPADLSFRGP